VRPWVDLPGVNEEQMTGDSRNVASLKRGKKAAEKELKIAVISFPLTLENRVR